MNRNLQYCYGHAQRQESILLHAVQPKISDEEPMKQNPMDSFLRLVYARNPRTKLPDGDLTYMVSDKANPEVKQWILDNLMMDTSKAATPSLTKGIDDDSILQLVRQPYEDRESYANRVNAFMRENVAMYERLSETLRQRSVSSKSSEPAVSAE